MRRWARGAPSLSTRLKGGRPVSVSASSTGLAIVARRQQEARLGAVDGGGAAQPAQHVGDVRAEHAAVDVRLVDDDEGEVGEQVAPGGVVGQDPDVQHVGVGDHEVAALADRRALLARACRRRRSRAGSACSGRSGAASGPGPGRAPWSGRGTARGPSGSVISTSSVGQLKAQRLARGGAGGDDRRAVEGLEQRLGLVGVEVLDPGVLQRVGDRPARARRGSTTSRPGRPS